MTSASDRERARACGALIAAVVQIPPVPLLVIGTESLVSVNVPRTCSFSSTAASPWMAFAAFGSLLLPRTRTVNVTCGKNARQKERAAVAPLTLQARLLSRSVFLVVSPARAEMWIPPRLVIT